MLRPARTAVGSTVAPRSKEARRRANCSLNSASRAARAEACFLQKPESIAGPIAIRLTRMCMPGLANDSSCVRDNRDVAQAITRDLQTMHGIPVFRGTRVPVQTLFDYLEGGDTLEDFLTGFPTVTRTLALEALEEAGLLLLASC